MSNFEASGGGGSIGSPIAGGTPESVLFIDASGNLAQDPSYFHYEEATHQFALGVNTFVSTEKQRILGVVTSPAPNEPTGGLLTFNYGPGGAYTATGQSHEYRLYANKAFNNSQFYSPLYLTIGPQSDDSRVVTADAPTNVTGSITYTAVGAYTAPSTGYSINVYGVITRSSGPAYSSGIGSIVSPTSDPSFTIGNSSSVSGTINYGVGNYTANGDTWTLSVWAYASSPITSTLVYSSSNADGSPGADDGSTDPYSIDWSWAAVTGATGYILELNGPTGPYYYDIGGSTSFTDDFTVWASGSANHTPTSQDEPYNIDWVFTAGANNESWVATSGSNYINLIGTGFTDDNTWTGSGFTGLPTSVPDDYYIDVSWTDSSPADGFIGLVSLNSGAFDTYYTSASTGFTDNNTALTPVPDVTHTSYSGIAENIAGDFYFSGKLIGSDQFIAESLVVGQDVGDYVSTGPFVGIGRNNIYNSNAGGNVVLFGVANTVNSTNNLTLIGSSNAISTSTSYTTVVGIANSLSTDGYNTQIFGNGNSVTARLSNVFGQSNSTGSPRSSIFGIINTIGSGSEHGYLIGYSNTLSGTSSESGAVGYLNAISSTNSNAYGRQNTIGTSDSSTTLGVTNTIGNSSGSSTIVGVNCSIGNSSSNSTIVGYNASIGNSSPKSTVLGYASSVIASTGTAAAMGIFANASAVNQVALAAVANAGEVTTLNVQSYSNGTSANVRNIFGVATSWQDSNNNTRRGISALTVYDTAAREAARLETNGSSGLFNATTLRVAILSSLGSEKITNGTFTGSAASWLLGTGWTYSSNTVLKNGNGTGTLSQTQGSMVTGIVPNQVYALTYTISAVTATSTITPSAAGVTLPTVAVAGTYTEYFTASSTADLTFTPSNTSRFTIDNISLKQITAGDLNVANNITATGTISSNGAIAGSSLTGSGFTSGRVPFATTGGLLTDDADFTFATDTLTITKIATTNMTTSFNLVDAVNISLGTSTGNKIGTSTSQKLGFWNTSPIAQPTTGIAASTFVANTSGTLNDSATWDSYTIGQVVKALRNLGILA